MKFLFSIAFVMPALVSFAFSSATWLKARDDDSDMERLKKAYVECSVKEKTPAEDVVLPLESWPDGTVKSRLRAKSAYVFLDSGFVWAEGIRVERYHADGKTLEGWIDADNCIVDRQSKSGWVDGFAELSFGKAEVKGKGVYFSAPREYLKICSDSEIRLKDVKIDTRSLMQ